MTTKVTPVRESMTQESITLPIKSVRISPLYHDHERISIIIDLPSPDGPSKPLYFFVDTHKGEGEKWVQKVLHIKNYTLV